MIVLLPRAGESLANFQRRLTVDQWNTWMGQLQPNEGAVALPRFTLANSFSLHAPLARLGMAPAFSRAADFSAICIHRCRRLPPKLNGVSQTQHNVNSHLMFDVLASSAGQRT